MKPTLTGEMLKKLKQFLQREERSGATAEKYLRDVRQFKRWLGFRPLSRKNVAAWKNALLAEGYSARSVNGKLSSLNALFRAIGREDCRVKTLRVQREVFRDAGRELTRSEYERLVRTAERLGKDRLALIMETICSCGLRVSELRHITLEAARNGKAVIAMKGKLRTILLPRKLRRKLEQYAKQHGITQGCIFITKTGTPISRRQIWGEMKALCHAAGVAPGKVFPHNLRHLFAVEYYRANRDIVKLADILGHSSIETTRIYLISTGAEHQKQIDSMRLVC